MGYSKSCLVLLGLALLSPAVAEDVKISAFTNPSGYVKKFPVNEATQTDLVESLGTPHRQMELEGKTLWSYDYGEPGLIRTYTFSIEGSVVTRVEFVGPLGRKHTKPSS
jgi:hypothetical protein